MAFNGLGRRRCRILVEWGISRWKFENHFSKTPFGFKMCAAEAGALAEQPDSRLVMGVGHPLLDISVVVSQDLLDKYGVRP